jgi:hypothetical protein
LTLVTVIRGAGGAQPPRKEPNIALIQKSLRDNIAIFFFDLFTKGPSAIDR